jgi:hypothetical protein
MNNTTTNFENVGNSLNGNNELINKIADILMQLSDEAKHEFYEFITWLEENKPSREDVHADLERRMA